MLRRLLAIKKVCDHWFGKGGNPEFSRSNQVPFPFCTIYSENENHVKSKPECVDVHTFGSKMSFRRFQAFIQPHGGTNFLNPNLCLYRPAKERHFTVNQEESTLYYTSQGKLGFLTITIIGTL